MVNSEFLLTWAGFCFCACMFMLTIATIFDTVNESVPYILMMTGLMAAFLFTGLIKKFVFEVVTE